MDNVSQFQSRYRAASHFRLCAGIRCLFQFVVSISLSSGFSFQVIGDSAWERGCPGFNLVIERLLISGEASKVVSIDTHLKVSISLSSGFSFQENVRGFERGYAVSSFNLVIERLLISGPRRIIRATPFPVFQSRYRAASHFRWLSLLKTFTDTLFQSRYRAASHFRKMLSRMPTTRLLCFNLVIERLLISGVALLQPNVRLTVKFQSRYRAASHFRAFVNSDNLACVVVSISLSSGFSFQDRCRFCRFLRR